jgi:hypothetical protein
MKKIIILLLTLIATVAFSKDYTLLVATKGSDAFKNAQKMANDDTIFAHKKIFKALSQATEILNKGQADTVNIKIANGKYEGKGKAGHWEIEDIKNIKGTLRVLGGYDNAFKKRAPFDTTTQLVVSETRNQPVFQLKGKKNQLREFMFSGFVIDVSPGNKYDSKTNSLLKKSSCTHNILNFGYLETFKLTISDNVLMNGAHMAAAPLIRPAGPTAFVIVKNNFIVNNIFAWKADAAAFKNKLKKYVFRNNSFILNWPYNPDPTSGTVATLEIADKNRLEEVEIIANIFAFNVGGAIMPLYKEKRMPKLNISYNIFAGNASLFSEKSYDVALIGKFNGAATYSSYTLEDMEDDFSWKIEKNISGNVKIDVEIADLKAGNSNSVKAKNTNMNSLRGVLGLNKQGGKVKISNFAPKLKLDIESFFSKEKNIKKLGVSRDLVEQF